MNRSYPYFPSFSMIFHDFPSFSTGQHMVKTWSACSYSYRGMVIPVIPVIPGCSVRSLRPRWCKSYRCDQQHPCWGPKWSTHRPIGISWDWPSRWLFYDEFCFWAMGYLGSFFWCTGSAGRLGDSPLTDYRCFCMLLPSRAPLIGDFLLPCLMSEG